MISYNVELLPVVDGDLDDIFDYILMDNSEAAEGVLEHIIASLKHLENFPNAGTKLNEESLKHYEFRLIIIKPYITFYRVIEKL